MRRGFAPLIIIIIMLAILVAAAIYLRTMSNRKLSENLPIINSTTGPDGVKYVQGEISVAFKAGTTYKEVRELFQRLDLPNYSNSYPGADPSPSDSTVVNTNGFDIFVIKVKPGSEREIIDKLLKEEIVRAASLNTIGHVTNI